MEWDKMGAVGLFSLAIAGTLLAIYLETVQNASPTYVAAALLVGSTTFGLGTASYIRWRNGTISWRRVVAIIGAFLGISVLVLSAGYLSGRLQLFGLLASVFLVLIGVLWNNHLAENNGVITRDERVEHLSYKASWRALQAVLFLVFGWYLLLRFTPYELPVEDILLTLMLTGTLGRIGLYRYYAQHQ